MQKSDDDPDMPEMTPSKFSAREQRQHARAILIRAAESKNMWDVMDGYALESAVELRMGIDSPDPKERFASARELLAAWTRLPQRPALPPQPGMSREEFDARVAAAEQEPAIREYFKRMGWTEPKAKGMGN